MRNLFILSVLTLVSFVGCSKSDNVVADASVVDAGDADVVVVDAAAAVDAGSTYTPASGASVSAVVDAGAADVKAK